ncbi:MAG: type II toxin-antitoxin system RelE/ParE family toxin [Candidatus Omnitrophota bacterium]
MDKFKVILLPQALKFYQNCSSKLANRLNRCFEDLENNPFQGQNIKRLKVKKILYRYRAGDYRIIYEIDKRDKRIGVLLITLRPSAYRSI